MPPDPLEGLKNFFSLPRGSEIFFRIDFPPKQKILDRTLLVVPLGDVQVIKMKHRNNKHLSDNWYCEINYNSWQ